jgi:hypothetical protein
MSVLQTKELHRGKESKEEKESESQEEKVILSLGVILALMPMELSLAAGHIQPPFAWIKNGGLVRVMPRVKTPLITHQLFAAHEIRQVLCAYHHQR